LQDDAVIASNLIIATKKYKEAMKLLLLHHELSSEEIERFQTLIEDSFEAWSELLVQTESLTISTCLLLVTFTSTSRNTSDYFCTHNKNGDHWMGKSKHVFIGVSSEEAKELKRVKSYTSNPLLWKTYEGDSFYIISEKIGIKR
jgi:hypothetical protein